MKCAPRREPPLPGALFIVFGCHGFGPYRTRALFIVVSFSVSPRLRVEVVQVPNLAKAEEKEQCWQSNPVLRTGGRDLHDEPS